MLQAASTDIVNPLVHEAHNVVSEYTISYKWSQIKSLLKLIDRFLFFALSPRH